MNSIYLIALFCFLFPLAEASEEAVSDKFSKPLEVPPGALYAFEKLDKKELEAFAKSTPSDKELRKRAKQKSKKQKVEDLNGVRSPQKESYICGMSKSIRCNVLGKDSSANGGLRVSKIATLPKLGTARIENNQVVYTATKRKVGIDTLHYEITDPENGKTMEGELRVLVCHDRLDGKYNTGNDPSVYVPPAAKFKNKQVRNPYKYFFASVKPIRGALKGDDPAPDMVYVFATKDRDGKDTLPAGYVWNYPYDKYFVKGNPVLTEGIGFSDLRINYRYIKKYTFSIDIENYTLSTKNHWRGFQKWGEHPDSERGTWTGDVGFTLEDMDFHPKEMVHGKVKSPAYYKLTTYEGITGYFTDRRTPEQIAANAPWTCIRVRIPLKDKIPASGGRMRMEFDFWPFLKFMIDHGRWQPGFPLGGPIGSEVYNNPGLSNRYSRPAGEAVVHGISHWVKSDLPPKKPIPPITLSTAQDRLKIKLTDIFSLPMMRRPIKGEVETHTWPPITPMFKLVSNTNGNILDATIENDTLVLKGKSKGHAILTIRCYDTFHEWFDDKLFSIEVK